MFVNVGIISTDDSVAIFSKVHGSRSEIRFLDAGNCGSLASWRTSNRVHGGGIACNLLTRRTF